MHGADAQWGLTELLLAANVDSVRVGNWQRGGGKGQYPKPLPRPGVKPESQPAQYGKGAGLTLREVVERQDRWARGVKRGRERPVQLVKGDP